MEGHGIDVQHIEEFNNWLSGKRSIVRLVLGKDWVEIKLVEDEYVESNHQTLRPNKLFYSELMRYFEGKGIRLVFNQSRTSFWSGEEEGEYQ